MTPTKLPRVVAAEAIGGHSIRVSFDDGITGTVNLADHVNNLGVFAPLADLTYFARVHVNPDAGTIGWPNGADLCPDVLYAMVNGVDPELYAELDARMERLRVDPDSAVSWETVEQDIEQTLASIEAARR